MKGKVIPKIIIECSEVGHLIALLSRYSFPDEDLDSEIISRLREEVESLFNLYLESSFEPEPEYEDIYAECCELFESILTSKIWQLLIKRKPNKVKLLSISNTLLIELKV